MKSQTITLGMMATLAGIVTAGSHAGYCYDRVDAGTYLHPNTDMTNKACALVFNSKSCSDCRQQTNAANIQLCVSDKHLMGDLSFYNACVEKGALGGNPAVYDG